MPPLKRVPLPTLDPDEVPDRVKRLYPKSGASDWIGELPNDPKPILYLSSLAGGKNWNPYELALVKQLGFRVFSYAYCGLGSPLMHRSYFLAVDECISTGVRMFLDSGAHSFHKMIRQGTTQKIMKGVKKEDRASKAASIAQEFLDKYALYVRWCYHTKRHFDFYVTFDWKKDCQTIWDATKKLQDKGIWPIPVYHGDQSLDWVRKYADQGHKLLGVGIDKRGKPTLISRRKYYDEVFSLCQKLGMLCHGLAVTSDLMFIYPFYSVDSSTFIKAASFGKILVITPGKYRVAQVHISDRYSEFTTYGNFSSMSPKVQSYLKEEVEARGFDWDRLRKEIKYRILYNAKIMVESVHGANHRKVDWTGWQSII